MLILETFKNAKENGLLNLKQGYMYVDAYYKKFITICHFVVKLDMSNENKRYWMFEKGLWDEIGSVVIGSLDTIYRKCIESVQFVEATMSANIKAKETQALTKVKVELGT